jgi:hypothetical protein
MFTREAVALNSVAVAAVVVIAPLFTAMSPTTTTPVACPILTPLASAPMFTLRAVLLNKLPVVPVVEITPLTCKVPTIKTLSCRLKIAGVADAFIEIPLILPVATAAIEPPRLIGCPDEFPTKSSLSVIFTASSPCNKLPLIGTPDTVVEFFILIFVMLVLIHLLKKKL